MDKDVKVWLWIGEMLVGFVNYVPNAITTILTLLAEFILGEADGLHSRFNNSYHQVPRVFFVSIINL
jgi:hypothetical protein